jgi:hypothetical protein
MDNATSRGQEGTCGDGQKQPLPDGLHAPARLQASEAVYPLARGVARDDRQRQIICWEPAFSKSGRKPRYNPLQTLDGALQLAHRRGDGEAQMALTALAEGDARHGRDTGLLQHGIG